MARAIWKGSISFGLVNIPVELYSGESRPDIQLRMLDSRNHARVRYERVNEDTGEEVPWDAIVRGYEFGENNYVLLSEEEMANVKPEFTKMVEIESFADLDEIDPVYFDKPYFMVPDEKHRGARKGYALLREALRKSGKVGIARVVIRTREYLCATMVRGDMLVVNLLRFSQELRDPAEYDLPGRDLKELKISDKEFKMAVELVAAMSEPWDPERFEDSYRAALMEWIDKKIEEGEYDVTSGPEEESKPKKAGKVVDLMDYLKQSVEEAREGREKPSKKAAKKSRPKKKAAKKTAAKKTARKRSAKKKAAGKRKAG